MRTSDWDAIAASEPLDRLAALVAAVGFSADEETMLAKAKSDIKALTQRDPNFRNLIGLKKGRLTVVAYGGSNKKASRARWIVRCVCGRYEARSTRALRPECTNDRCDKCNDLDRIRKGFHPLHRDEVAA
jgi:hypothetical protein